MRVQSWSHISVALVGLSLASLVGCSAEEPAPEEDVIQGAQSIVGGEADTDDDAVAYIVSAQGGECTATIIGISGDTGYALTAAHCVTTSNGGGCNPVTDPPVELWLGDRIYDDATGQPAADSRHPVTSYVTHPSWNPCSIEAGNDYAILTFSGANALMPVIPPLSPAEDDLAPGREIEHVGYGLYNNPACDSPGGGLCYSNIRRTATATIGTLNANDFDYVQNWEGNPGGPCSGDSGGPQFVQTANGKRIAGLTSYGDGPCVEYGVSVRTSVVYDSFILPNMNGVTPGPAACGECKGASTTAGSCVEAFNGCQADPECAALDACASACADDGCLSDCAKANPNGRAGYEAMAACFCSSDCASNCSGAAVCANGGTLPSGSSGGGSGSGGDDDDDDTTTTTCSATPGPVGGSWAALLGAAALAFAFSRRRRSSKA